MFKNLKKSMRAVVMTALAIVMTLSSSITVFADNSQQALINLRSTIVGGEYTSYSTQNIYDFKENTYKTSGGGYLIYSEIMDTSVVAETSKPLFDETQFGALTAGAKQDFLKDVFTICNAMADDSARGYGGAEDSVTDETVASFMNIVQQQSGMGSQLLATLLQNTKPNYVAANRIYEPFSGVVGTILGLISILIIALLGVTMALDIAYIMIPAVQLAFGGENGEGKGVGKLISKEAISAANAAGNSGGSDGGENRLAIALYFKSRWLGLVVLGICLLYLVQGQIYSFVAWIIDLMSGFLGF